jgi:nondiscriminating glutamyl-tRNA synthetase
LFEREGRRPSIRFAVPEEQTVVVDDIVRGRCEFQSSQFGDFIILRSDGGASFHLANVVDDHLMGVTHVVRGEDHFPNTPRHILLYRALGFEVPRFAHLSMILGPDRSKLSKRHGAVSVESFRAAGYLPEAMVNYLALLGWAPADEQEVMTPEEIVAKFDLERVNKSAAVFDYGKLDYLNGLRIRQEPLKKIVALGREFFAGGAFGGDGVPVPGEMDEARFERLIDLARVRSDTLAQIPEKCRSILEAPAYSEQALALLRETSPTGEVLKVFAEPQIASPAMKRVISAMG